MLASVLLKTPLESEGPARVVSLSMTRERPKTSFRYRQDTIENDGFLPRYARDGAVQKREGRGLENSPSRTRRADR